ncbi:MAG TPA: hypothetical protein VHO84_14270, partial [Syntrophorhabdaceae bacterium]|nr:hypothetical protein [Syntrophorhabdaceae bacterium]
HSRLTVPFVPNSTPYPEKTLDFRANVLNTNARKFYNRHGIETVQPAFETLSDAKEKVVMITRYCIRRELDLCEKHCASANVVRKPMRISDRHHAYRLVFDCRRCSMSLILEK